MPHRLDVFHGDIVMNTITKMSQQLKAASVHVSRTQLVPVADCEPKSVHSNEEKDRNILNNEAIKKQNAKPWQRRLVLISVELQVLL
jgi:hypothetical protein